MRLLLVNKYFPNSFSLCMSLCLYLWMLSKWKIIAGCSWCLVKIYAFIWLSFFFDNCFANFFSLSLCSMWYDSIFNGITINEYESKYISGWQERNSLTIINVYIISCIFNIYIYLWSKNIEDHWLNQWVIQQSANAVIKWFSLYDYFHSYALFNNNFPSCTKIYLVARCNK